jgi:hypothetical protein
MSNKPESNDPPLPSEEELRAWVRDLDYVLNSEYALPDGKRADMQEKRTEYVRKLRKFYGVTL